MQKNAGECTKVRIRECMRVLINSIYYMRLLRIVREFFTLQLDAEECIQRMGMQRMVGECIIVWVNAVDCMRMYRSERKFLD